jgi:hypothetical protein
VDKGEGIINVEALDEKGNYRNFLDLQTYVVSPKGERVIVRLEQTGPGHYEAKFPTKEVGTYLLNMQEMDKGNAIGSQVVGASVSYSPEFTSPEPNVNLLRRLAESGGGMLLDPANLTANPFLHDRARTYQAQDLWEWLLKLAVILFVADVGIRRIQIDREEWLRATAGLRRILFFWKGKPSTPEAQESLSNLLAAREGVRGGRTAPGARTREDLFKPVQAGAPIEYQPGETEAGGEPVSTAPIAPRPPAGAPKPEGEQKPAPEPGGTTSRLLEAKRRAQQRKK